MTLPNGNHEMNVDIIIKMHSYDVVTQKGSLKQAHELSLGARTFISFGRRDWALGTELNAPAKFAAVRAKELRRAVSGPDISKPHFDSSATRKTLATYGQTHSTVSMSAPTIPSGSSELARIALAWRSLAIIIEFEALEDRSMMTIFMGIQYLASKGEEIDSPATMTCQPQV